MPNYDHNPSNLFFLIFILFFKNRTNHKVNNNNKYYFGLLSRYSYHILLFRISAYYSCSNFTVVFNWNYPFNDISTVSSMTFPSCCSWCLSNSTCTTFVYSNSMSECWIKTSRGSGGNSDASMIAAYR